MCSSVYADQLITTNIRVYNAMPSTKRAPDAYLGRVHNQLACFHYILKRRRGTVIHVYQLHSSMWRKHDAIHEGHHIVAAKFRDMWREGRKREGRKREGRKRGT